MKELKDFEEKTIEREEIFDGFVIKVARDTVELPNNLGTAKRELVFHPGGVTVIPITPEGKIVLVKQFRKPLEKVILEIPAGKIEPDEYDDLENAAKRELEEETGYKANTFEKLTEVYLSVGFCDELLRFYVATDLEKVENPRPKDEDEILELYELTYEEAKQAEREGLICDSKTVMALMYWEIWRLQGKMS
ncbi:ADP-ribose pyrophosphatase [Pilibacter termitis]|jgi:ADP-ribose pyrophosphatase|uniref:ADP-ribose pyrophosphatase n=1 Tax=Pilibacter termitis TaxID=263852 RepID=A0A1T4Q6J5_9ENTE|nr:NUDIX hydrolase [Pilibacter termitis]SJZ99403.1 ADP-ribose pyrophosphatase [Pilibacter termitis]